MSEKRKEILGTIAGIMTTGALVPQVYTVWSQVPKPAEAVSLQMYLIISLGLFLWIIYGLCLRSRPLTVFNSITFVLSLLVLVYKLIYG